MRVLVTGGCGFIGRNLLAWLGARDFRLRVLDNLSAGGAGLAGLPQAIVLDADDRGADWSERVGFVPGDVRDLATVRRACRGADAVVHLAASTGIVDSMQDPLEHCENNATGTLVVLEAARREGVRRCVVASSGAAVGDVPPPVHERQVPRPVSPYGASKLAAEAYCMAYRAGFGLPTHALRFSNVYGPHSGHKTSAVARFITTVLDGVTLTVYGDGEQTRDFIFVGDLVEAVRLALVVPGAAHCVYQIASGVETSVNALIGTLATLAQARLGRSPAIEYRPARPGEVLRSVADITLARRELGWEPATPLARGLELTFDWFVAERGAAAAGTR